VDSIADICAQDNSGTIEREEFLSLPQISSNPLATRCAHPSQQAAHTQQGRKEDG
jgi:hypothetical protein